MLFVIIAGSYIGFQTGWVGYKVAGGFFPYGANGMLAGSATVFFAYIGFDSVASTAEEVRKHPISLIDLPLLI
jgi:cationic amino acid transporter 1